MKQSTSGFILGLVGWALFPVGIPNAYALSFHGALQEQLKSDIQAERPSVRIRNISGRRVSVAILGRNEYNTELLHMGSTSVLLPHEAYTVRVSSLSESDVPILEEEWKLNLARVIDGEVLITVYLTSDGRLMTRIMDMICLPGVSLNDCAILEVPKEGELGGLNGFRLSSVDFFSVYSGGSAVFLAPGEHMIGLNAITGYSRDSDLRFTAEKATRYRIIMDEVGVVSEGKTTSRKVTVRGYLAGTNGSFVDGLSDPRPDIRLRAAQALGEMRDMNALKPLVRLLNDKTLPGVSDSLKALLLDKEKNALSGFYTLPNELYKTWFGTDMDPNAARAMAAWALGQLEDPAAVEALKRAMTDAEEMVRLASIASLKRIGEIRSEK